MLLPMPLSDQQMTLFEIPNLIWQELYQISFCVQAHRYEE